VKKGRSPGTYEKSQWTRKCWWRKLGNGDATGYITPVTGKSRAVVAGRAQTAHAGLSDATHVPRLFCCQLLRAPARSRSRGMQAECQPCACVSKAVAHLRSPDRVGPGEGSRSPSLSAQWSITRELARKTALAIKKKSKPSTALRWCAHSWPLPCMAKPSPAGKRARCHWKQWEGGSERGVSLQTPCFISMTRAFRGAQRNSPLFQPPSLQDLMDSQSKAVEMAPAKPTLAQ